MPLAGKPCERVGQDGVSSSLNRRRQHPFRRIFRSGAAVITVDFVHRSMINRINAHEGLRRAIEQVLAGATWQRCRVHFMRNVLSQVPKSSQSMVSSIIRTIFAQPSQEAAVMQLRQVAQQLRGKFPKAMDILEQAESDVLAYMAFPREHWRQIHSTNPLERLNREIRRRSDVVGIFPNRESVIRLIGAILIEQQDEWTVARRYFSLESMTKVVQGEQLPLASTTLLQK